VLNRRLLFIPQSDCIVFPDFILKNKSKVEVGFGATFKATSGSFDVKNIFTWA
jgi:hypothetical protein